LMAQYVELGLDLASADNAVESGLTAVWMRLYTGRLKVFRTLQNWLREYRLYRRDENGKIVKQNDHLMDCTRYLENSGFARAIIRPPELWTLGKKSTGHVFEYDPCQVK
jgi:hypothetical protein